MADAPYEYRNAAYNAFGGIDCEINHAEFGWIPFTANADDAEQTGKDMFAALAAADPAPTAYVASPPAKDELKLYAQTKRFALANGSAQINVGDRSIPVWTDTASQTAILGLLPAAQADPEFVLTNWKGSDGNFYDLTSSEIIALWQGGMTFVGTCFNAEAAVGAAIDAGTITTYAAIDAYAWPTGT